jgi:hypothetical protein
MCNTTQANEDVGAPSILPSPPPLSHANPRERRRPRRHSSPSPPKPTRTLAFPALFPPASPIAMPRPSPTHHHHPPPSCHSHQRILREKPQTDAPSMRQSWRPPKTGRVGWSRPALTPHRGRDANTPAFAASGATVGVNALPERRKGNRRKHRQIRPPAVRSGFSSGGRRVEVEV